MASEMDGIKAVIDEVEKLHQVEFHYIDHPSIEGIKAPIAVVPQGMAVKALKDYLEPYLPAPERRAGTALFHELDSFIAHVKRFSDTDSVIFADPNENQPTLTAVLDYHRTGAEGAPRFGKHRSFYKFPVSDEWKAWKKNDGVMMNQDSFAEFIEENIEDIIDPASAGETIKAFVQKLGLGTPADPARMLELSRGLAVRIGASVSSFKNLSTGEYQVNFEVAHQTKEGGPLNLPGAFAIGIPLFRAGNRYQLGARLRIRVQAGDTPHFAYSLYRTDVVFDFAFKEACAKAATETGRPLLVGQPE